MTDEAPCLPPDAPAPRLCHLIKWPDFDGYGFNLHAEKSKCGQFVGKVDDQSPAQAAGLREGDRIIEVNGVNIANENHRQVSPSASLPLSLPLSACVARRWFELSRGCVCDRMQHFPRRRLQRAHALS